MTKIIIAFAALLLVETSFASFPKESINKNVVVKNEKGLIRLTEGLTQMTVKDYEKLTGKKLSFINKLFFSLAKKKAIVAHKIQEDTTGFNLGGLALGMFLGPLGVIGAYVFSKDRNLRKWAWIGLAVFVVAILIIGAIETASLFNFQ